jgi:predicted esterase
MNNCWRLLTAWVIMNGLTSGTVYAQSIDQIFNKFIKGYHTYQSITLPYYLFVPANYDPRTKYPLVLCLHGAGEKGDNPWAVKNNSMAIVWARDTNQTKWPCFILVPQCPITGSWVYLPGPGSYSTDAIPISPELLTVSDIVDSLLVKYSIDPDRLYITGLSMGGFATWDLIVRFPNKFAAAVPMSGAGDTSKAALIKHIPVWDFHGALDNVVPVRGSREMISALEKAGVPAVYTHCHNGDCIGLPDSIIADRIRSGGKLFYTEYQYGSHAIWDQAYNSAFLLPWTFSQSKTNVSVRIGTETFSSLPEEYGLSQNYPNPFNPTTTIRYDLPAAQHVRLALFNALGQEIAMLLDEQQSRGHKEITFDGRNLPSGVYFYRIIAGPYMETKKLILLK